MKHNTANICFIDNKNKFKHKKCFIFYEKTEWFGMILSSIFLFINALSFACLSLIKRRINEV